VAQLTELPRTRRLILDSGGVLALSEGSPLARAALERARREGFVVIIPTPILTEVHRGGRHRARIDRVVNAVDALVPTTAEVARLAGELLARTETDDPVDAIVAAEALMSVPAVIVTGDGQDLRRLIADQPDGMRVAIVDV
jgi:sugar/nucleoside kinase (ribokinase family)